MRDLVPNPPLFEMRTGHPSLMKDLRLSSIVGMFLVIDLSAGHTVVAAGPGTQVDQMAALGTEGTESIVLRHVGRLFADWTAHTSRNLPDRRPVRNARRVPPHGSKPWRSCHYMALEGKAWSRTPSLVILTHRTALRSKSGSQSGASNPGHR